VRMGMDRLSEGDGEIKSNIVFLIIVLLWRGYVEGSVRVERGGGTGG